LIHWEEGFEGVFDTPLILPTFTRGSERRRTRFESDWFIGPQIGSAIMVCILLSDSAEE
jgi:hypothetical protein